MPRDRRRDGAAESRQRRGAPGKAAAACGKPKSERDLPRSLGVLWRAARRAEPQPALTLERIVAAGIEIADREGLGALSMARLAERLGSAPMSLYRHVASKDDLQLLMADAASGEAPQGEWRRSGWRRGLRQWARALRAVYDRHPWILEISARHPPLEPGHLAWLDSGLRTLRATSLRPAEKLAVILLVLHYVRGEAQLAAVRMQGNREPPLDDREMKIWYGRTLARLVDAERFPALSELVAAGTFEPSDDASDADDDFAFGLELLLDGVGALVDSIA